MTTIKKSINTTATKSNSKEVKNTFSFNENTGILTLKLEVERTKSGNGLKAKHLTDIKSEKSEYKCVEFSDSKGNVVKLYKTGFDYVPVVKEPKGISLDPKKLEKLDSTELSVLEAILAKLA